MFATGRVLTFGIFLSTLSGCAAFDVTAWYDVDANDTRASSAQSRQATARPVAPSGWIVDDVSNCATSNPRPTAGESIRWFGSCSNGKLGGQGTLIWYRDGREVERNEGGFRGGELHGEVVTTFDDGGYIVGEYVDGQRNGNFIIRRPDSSYLHTIYEDGKLSARRVPSTAEIDAWLLSRARRVANAAETPAANKVENAPAQALATQLAEGSPRPAPKVSAMKVAPASARRSEPQGQVPSVQIKQKKIPAIASTTTSGLTLSYSDATVNHSSTIVVSSTSVTKEPTFVGVAALPSGHSQLQALTAAFQPAVYRPRVANPLSGVTQSAIMYAGRDGPWVVGSRTGGAMPARSGTIIASSGKTSKQDTIQDGAVQRANYAPSHVLAAARPPRAISDFNSASNVLPRQSKVAPLAMPATPVVAEVQRAPATPKSPAVSPDVLFSRGYQLELAGQRQAAERVYDKLLLQYPSAPAALLANARIVQLRQPKRLAVQLAQSRNNPSVVTVNSPEPSGTLRPASLTPSQASRSPALHRQICSRDGLYESNSGWCGTVTGEQGLYYWVRVDDVYLRGFATIGITRSACTGNNFLTWFSRGSSVKVPKQCMTFQVG